MTDLENSHKAILTLIGDFEAHERVYRASDYNETEVRNAFIDKFYTALGWDVGHVRQKDPFAQEVKVEKGVNDRGSRRRADYAFYVTPNFQDPKFYVEAKRPSVDLATKDNYFQVIRYGWNSQTPIAVITNFHQTHLLDCRYKPDIDTALERRIGVYTLNKLKDPDEFAKLYFLLSGIMEQLPLTTRLTA